MIKERKVLMGKTTGRDRKEIKDADRIIALALLKHLYKMERFQSVFLGKLKNQQWRKFQLKIVNLYANIKM